MKMTSRLAVGVVLDSVQSASLTCLILQQLRGRSTPVSAALATDQSSASAVCETWTRLAEVEVEVEVAMVVGGFSREGLSR